MLYSQATRRIRKPEDDNLSDYLRTSSRTLPLESIIRMIAELVGRKKKMTVLHKAMKVIVGPPEKYENKAFVFNTRKLFQWQSVPLLVSIDCDTPKSKDM